MGTGSEGVAGVCAGVGARVPDGVHVGVGARVYAGVGAGEAPGCRIGVYPNPGVGGAACSPTGVWDGVGSCGDAIWGSRPSCCLADRAVWLCRVWSG